MSNTKPAPTKPTEKATEKPDSIKSADLRKEHQRIESEAGGA